MSAEIILSSVATDLVANVIKGFLRQRVESAEKAQKQYETRIGQGLVDPIRKRREELITQAKSLQTRLLLELPNSELQIKLVAVTYESIETVYSANNESDFLSVDMNFGLIEANLENNSKRIQREKQAKNMAIYVSGIAIVVVVALAAYIGATDSGYDSSQPLPLVNIPASIILWSFIGSMTAILYRFNVQQDTELQDPFRWLYTRPVTGVVMGIILYLAMQSGLLALQVEDTPNIGGMELAWIAAFIGGFSDRLADSLLKLLVGRFGGDASEDVLDRLKSLEGFGGLTPDNYRFPAQEGSANDSNTETDPNTDTEAVNGKPSKDNGNTNPTSDHAKALGDEAELNA